MYKRILIATDGSPLSDKAVASGLALARLSSAKVVALKVIPRYPRNYFEGGLPIDSADIERVEKQWSDAAQTLVDKVRDMGAGEGVEVKAVLAKSDLVVASRTIIWSLVKQVRVCVMPLFHGLHRRTALER